MTMRLQNSLILITASIFSTSLTLLGVLPLDTSRSATSKWRLEAEVNVLLRVQTDNERRNVDNLLPDTDMPLSNQDTCVMNRLGKPKFKDLSLKTALQKILYFQTKDIIELHLALIQDANPDQTSQEGISFKQPLGILLLQGEQNPSSGPDLGQTVLDSPDLSLVSEPILSNKFQLLVKTGLLKRSPWSGVSFGVHLGYSAVYHLGNKSLFLL